MIEANLTNLPRQLWGRAAGRRKKYLFDRRSDQIRPAGTAKLRALVAKMQRSPDATVVVKGYTVGRGDEADSAGDVLS